MNEQHSSLVLVLAGIGFFMYGMTLASDNLQKLAANRIRDIITTLAKRPLWGVGLGILLTVILQSSGAVTSMLVGLGSAHVVSLAQVMSVILGTAIGSTVTVQIISFNVAQYGLPLFGLAFSVYFISRKRTLVNLMAVLMGFGLIFFGLEVISMGTEKLKDVELFTSLLRTMKENPFYALMITAFFTAVVHSSAATIGLAMSMASSGILTLTDSVYWVFGANVGTTATALLASMGGNYIGRQVAWAHCFYKLTSVMLFYPFAEQLAEWMSTGQVGRDIANIHTAYNFAAAVFFYPFILKGATVVESFFPPTPEEREYSVKYIDKGDWESPAVVLAHAEREMMRMADLVQSMLDDSLKIFRRDDPDLEAEIRKRDDRVDLLNREISLYLARNLEEAPAPVQMNMMRILTFIADMESAADVIDNQLLDLAKKKHTLRVDFSSEGWQELEQMHGESVRVTSMSIACFQSQNHDLARNVVHQKREIRDLEKHFRERHIARLVKGRPESISTSSIHLDVLGEYRRIVGLMSSHVYATLKEMDKETLPADKKKLGGSGGSDPQGNIESQA